MTDQPKLKPCPFCGSEPFSHARYAIHVWCRCGANQRCEVPGEAWRAWNTRPSPWIPVGERMPKDFETVFVVDKDGDCGSGWYDRHWIVTDGVSAKTITHWQLPEVP